MHRTPSPLRRLAAVGALLLAGAALTSCAAAASADEASGSVVIRDGALRVPDADCAGSGAFLFAHAGATLTVVDAHDDLVHESTLAPGTPLRADEKDYGVAKRVPTFCVFDFDASSLIDGATYTFRIDDTEIGVVPFQRDADGRGLIAYPALGTPTTDTGDDE